MKGRVKFESLIEKNDNCEENERTNCYNKGKVYRTIKTKSLRRNNEEIERKREMPILPLKKRLSHETERERERERGRERERERFQ